MSRSVFVLVAGWVLASSVPLMAQDALLGQIYGNGVHAYFAQDYVKAHQLLTSVIDGHSQDPRCFYFRGLALLKLGRPQEAESDFQRGAKLESAIDSVRAYDVARSLERIQGTDRSTLEEFRMKARVAVLQKAEAENRVRYEASQKEQRAFLQQQSEAAPARSVESATEGPKEVPGEGTKAPGVVPPNTPPADPFKDDAVPGATPAAPATPEVPAGAAKPDAGNPLGDAEPKPAAPGGEMTKPTAPAAGAAQPEAAKPDSGDLFGDGGGAAKPAAPATGAAQPEAAKPDAAKKVDAKPSDAKPADGGDPFGDAGGAAKPAAPAAGAAQPEAAKPDAAPAGGTAREAANPTAKKPEAEKSDAKPAGGGDPFNAEPAGKAAEPAAVPAEKKAAEKKSDEKKSDEKKSDEKKSDEKKPAPDADPFG